MTNLLARARALLTDQRGNYVAQQMVGAMLSLLVMSAITVSIVSASTIFRVIAERTDVTQQATATSSALRSDTTWASAILPAAGSDGREVAFIVPGRDAHCQESTWQLRETETDDGQRLQLVNIVAGYEEYDTSTTPVTCTGARLLLTEQVMVRDLDPEARFRFYNAGGRQFDDPASGTFLPACSPGDDGADGTCQADPPSDVKERHRGAKAVTSVELTTTVGKHSTMAMAYSFRETATNLHKAPARPAAEDAEMPSFFQDHTILGG